MYNLHILILLKISILLTNIIHIQNMGEAYISSQESLVPDCLLAKEIMEKKKNCLKLSF